MLFMIDTCQANTMYSKIYSPNILATGSSELDQSSYSHHADNDVGVAVIDRYTYYNLEFLETQVRDQSSKLTLGQLFDSYDESKIHSSPGMRYDLFPGGEEGARNRLVMDFFGNVQNVEVEDAQDSTVEAEKQWQEDLEALSRMIEAAKKRHNATLTEDESSIGKGMAAQVSPQQSPKTYAGPAKVDQDGGWQKQLVGISALAGCAGLWALSSWFEASK
jgi:GPI-anchor transamidase subunit K